MFSYRPHPVWATYDEPTFMIFDEPWSFRRTRRSPKFSCVSAAMATVRPLWTAAATDIMNLVMAGRDSDVRSVVSLSLVGSRQLRRLEDVPFHRGEELGARGLLEIGEHGVERVERVDVPVAANRRAGTAVAGAAPVVRSFERARREPLRRRRFAKGGAVGGKVVEHPAHPGPLRGLRV